MSGWTFAWDRPDADAADVSAPALLRGVRNFALGTGVALALGLFAYGTGLISTLGWAQGSERHGTHAARVADEGGFGLPTIYAFRGQHLWWDYDVTVEGRGGIWLWISRSPPSRDFVTRTLRVDATGHGRFEVIAPESGFYSFHQEYLPYGVLIDRSRPGSTRYNLTWGVD